ncbi:MAG: hypothetical protein R3E97_02815 [Candidatus Eisenbacteria bacterium]
MTIESANTPHGPAGSAHLDCVRALPTDELIESLAGDSCFHAEWPGQVDSKFSSLREYFERIRTLERPSRLEALRSLHQRLGGLLAEHEDGLIRPPGYQPERAGILFSRVIVTGAPDDSEPLPEDLNSRFRHIVARSAGPGIWLVDLHRLSDRESTRLSALLVWRELMAADPQSEVEALASIERIERGDLSAQTFLPLVLQGLESERAVAQRIRLYEQAQPRSVAGEYALLCLGPLPTDPTMRARCKALLFGEMISTDSRRVAIALAGLCDSLSREERLEVGTKVGRHAALSSRYTNLLRGPYGHDWRAKLSYAAQATVDEEPEWPIFQLTVPTWFFRYLPYLVPRRSGQTIVRAFEELNVLPQAREHPGLTLELPRNRDTA